MGSFTWTYSQSPYSFSGRVTYTDMTTIKVSEESFNVPAPSATIAITANYSPPSRCQYIVVRRYGYYTFASGTSSSTGWEDNPVWTSSSVANGTEVPFPSASKSATTSSFFSSNNPTDAYTDFTFKWPSSTSLGGSTYIYTDVVRPGSGPAGTVYNMGTVRAYLDAPPTFGVSEISYDTSSHIYANLTTASVTVDAVSDDYGAKYGGYITKIRFEIGPNQYDELEFTENNQPTSSETLSIPLTIGGTHQANVIITDSRGQTTTTSLGEIVVNIYTSPDVTLAAERTLGTTGDEGVPADEGTYATVKVDISNYIYQIRINKLLEPIVKVTDENGTTTTVNPTWYTTRDSSTGKLSGSRSWSSYRPSSSTATVYALISGFDPLHSYDITVTARDFVGPNGLPKTVTLVPAFFTVDFLAGGHGIAFGKPASETGFHCAMNAIFEGTLTAQDMTAQEVEDFVDNIGGDDNLIADVVIEQGASGIWTYRKWNSGVVEMWGNAQSLTVSGGYYAVPLPFAISDSFYPIVNVTGWYGTDANRDAVSVYQTYGGIVNNSVVVYVRTSAGAVIYSGYGRASIYLYGRWK